MRNKNYTKQIVDNFCVLDVETTGLSVYYNEVIEIGVLRVRNNEVVARYSQLVKPEYEVDSFITSLTGITNEMLADMPSIMDVKEDVLSFLGTDVVVGHNTSFDMRFLNEGFKLEVGNQYVDTLQFVKKLYPELQNHRLDYLAEFLNLTRNEHRALADCITTKELYDSIKSAMAERGLKIENLWSPHNHGHGGHRIDVNTITATTDDFDTDGFFFGRHVVFTGELGRMRREDAMQKVVNLGGILDKSGVKKTTNYLIVGSTKSNSILRGEKSANQKKAEELKHKGQDIEIIDEQTFYDLLEESE